MTDNDLAFTCIRSVISQITGKPVDSIGIDDSLIGDLLLDSIELIELLTRLEELNVVVAEHKINERLTVRDLVDLAGSITT